MQVMQRDAGVVPKDGDVHEGCLLHPRQVEHGGRRGRCMCKRYANDKQECAKTKEAHQDHVVAAAGDGDVGATFAAPVTVICGPGWRQRALHPRVRCCEVSAHLGTWTKMTTSRTMANHQRRACRGRHNCAEG